jgi:hypothetical protein
MGELTHATFVVTHPRELPQAVAPQTHTVADDVAADTVSNTPVRTGRLAAGWKVSHYGGTEWLVTNEVPYAKHVEFGTRHAPPVGMLGRAFSQAKARYG